MTLFSAAITSADPQHPSVELKFALNGFDRNPRRVRLTTVHPLNAWDRLPFSYQYVDEGADGASQLIVLAAPGVDVSLENFPDREIVRPGVPGLSIYRVQDPALLPPLAYDLRTSSLVGTTTENAPSMLYSSVVGGGAAGAMPANYFEIDHLPDGVVIRHPATTMEFVVDVAQLSRAGGTPTTNAADRFTYYIDPDGIAGNSERPLLRIAMTPTVRFHTTDRILERGLRRMDISPIAALEICQVFQVPDINRVPPPGVRIEPSEGWRRLMRLPRVEPVAEIITTSVLDIAVGLIPGVGDAVDIAEFLYATAAGTDRWGRTVTTGDLVIMGVGALLPFVSSPMLRSAARLRARFGGRADAAGQLLTTLREANLSRDEIALLSRVDQGIRAGRHIEPALLRQAEEVLARVRGGAPTLDSLLNADASGFLRTDLQELYRAYLQRPGGTGLPPRQWALTVRSGRPREILTALLGEGYARRAPVRRALDRVVTIADVPRPPSLSEARVRDELMALAQEQPRLFERLGALLDASRHSDETIRATATSRVSSGRFSILKGNIAEMKSLAKQRAVLRDVASRYPGARIITGVKVRVMENGTLSPARLFSDNIIAIERGGQLQVHAVFEVKSGAKGGAEATEQIFDWVEGALEEGSQLVLPSGARVIDADGAVRTLERERAFTYQPGRTGPATVAGMASAERHLITAAGTSHLGLDSSAQLARPPIRHELDLTADELDYLTARVLMTLAR